MVPETMTPPNAPGEGHGLCEGAARKKTARKKTAVASLSVASNTLLTLGKLAVGLAIGSVSVISEAAHSAVDLLAALIALFSVRRSDVPADERHAFGHGKLENLSGVIEALLIFGAAGWIIWEAVEKLRHPTPVETPILGVAVMATAALVNMGVSHLLFRVGRETESQALLADAWHLRTDVWTSVGVMVGLTVITLGGWFLPQIDLSWVDPVIAFVVAVLIMHAAWQLTLEAGRDLLDESLPAADLEWIRDTLHARIPALRSLHRLRTRRGGADRFIDFHMVLDPQMTLVQAHDAADQAEHLIQRRFPRASVVVHVEPCDRSCQPVCLAGCKLSAQQRAALDSCQPGDAAQPMGYQDDREVLP